MPAEISRGLQHAGATAASALGRYVRMPRQREPARAIIAALIATSLATPVLLAIDRHLGAEHLIIGYLLPTAIIAMHFGGTAAVLTCFLSGVAGSYFLFPPKFSFLIADPRHVVELGFFLLLALTAGKALAVAANGGRTAGRGR